MKLTKFQRYVKERKVTAFRNMGFAVLFADEILSARFESEYLLMLENVNARLDMDTMVHLAIGGHNVEIDIKNSVHGAVNELIKTTLEEIEDIEEVNEMEQDCCDVFKREQELNQ